MSFKLKEEVLEEIARLEEERSKVLKKRDDRASVYPYYIDKSLTSTAGSLTKKINILKRKLEEGVIFR